jgi:geranylgeranyl pyrophosphate synthase
VIKIGFKFHSQVPKLASAAEYFFKMGVQGKRFRPTVTTMMLMCSLFGFASRLCSASV